MVGWLASSSQEEIDEIKEAEPGVKTQHLLDHQQGCVGSANIKCRERFTLCLSAFAFPSDTTTEIAAPTYDSLRVRANVRFSAAE